MSKSCFWWVPKITKQVLSKFKLSLFAMNYWDKRNRYSFAVILGVTTSLLNMKRFVSLLLLLFAVGGRGEWPISQPPRAEAFSRPSAQPVSTQRCVHVCVCIGTRPRCPHMHVHMRVLWAVLCPVYFSSPATLRHPSTALAIPSQPTHTGRGQQTTEVAFLPAQWSNREHPSLLLSMLPAFTVYRGQRRALFPARD